MLSCIAEHMLIFIFAEMCIRVSDEYRKILDIGETLNISSNNYPRQYPIAKPFGACVRRYSARNGGTFKFNILDAQIGLQDTIGIGIGLNPSFASTLYATNSAIKMPVRDNHPQSIFIPSLPVGSHMWLVFGVGTKTNGLLQFSTISTGFLVQISIVEEPGK